MRSNRLLTTAQEFGEKPTHTHKRRDWNNMSRGEKFGVWTVVTRISDPRSDVKRSSTAWYLVQCMCGERQKVRRCDRNELSKTCTHSSPHILKLTKAEKRAVKPHIAAIRSLYLQGVPVSRIVDACALYIDKRQILHALRSKPSLLSRTLADIETQLMLEANHNGE